jgi:hypothetical protein
MDVVYPITMETTILRRCAEQETDERRAPSHGSTNSGSGQNLGMTKRVVIGI